MRAYITAGLLLLIIFAGCINLEPESKNAQEEQQASPTYEQTTHKNEETPNTEEHPSEETVSASSNDLIITELNGHSAADAPFAAEFGDTENEIMLHSKLFKGVTVTKAFLIGCGEREFEHNGDVLKIKLDNQNCAKWPYYKLTISVIMSERTQELNDAFPFCTAQTSMPGLAICSANFVIKRAA